jgi:magnesium transporter
VNTAETKRDSSSRTSFNLSELLDVPVVSKGGRIGKLDEFVIVDHDKFAEVTHLCVARPFGRPTLFVPWEKVVSFGAHQVVVDLEDPEAFAKGPPHSILLKDYILDKRVLDEKGRELEVVYDIGLTLSAHRLLVVDVDLSKTALLRRIKLGWLAKFLVKPGVGHDGDVVPWSYVAPLPEQLGSFKGDVQLKVLKEQLAELPPVDLADILEELRPDQRNAIFGALDTERASDTLEALDPKVQRDLVASLDKEKIARLIAEMTPAQAADLLAVLPWWDVRALMNFLDNRERAAKINAILQKQDEKAVHASTARFLRMAPQKTVAQARAEFAQAAKGKLEITYIYIVDESDKLLGVLDAKTLLVHDEQARLDEVMTSQVVSLGRDDSLRRASELFERYLFRALPVIDEHGKILGVLRYRDVVALRHRYVE